MCKNSELQRELIDLLSDKKLKVATAESCTGGLISKRITDISGAGEVFDCGICSYANSIKASVLGVRQTTLDKFGAVSAQTAAEMSRAVRKLAGADIGIATTGIAGPTGATKNKPIGLVYISVASKGKVWIKKCLFNKYIKHSRADIRKMTSDAALKMAISLVKDM